MTDRDRLAAEIDRHWLFRTDDMVFRCSADDWEDAPDDTVAEGDHYQPFSAHIADRLIALGWTRGVVGCDCKIVRECYDPTHGPLDEERLARALGPHPQDPELRAKRAAAIAKAYREDAGLENAG